MTKRQKVYAFIDSQNLNLGTSKSIYKKQGKGYKRIYQGWDLDFKKFRRYLTDKFRVSKAFLYIGYIKENRNLYRRLKNYGYLLIYKPTVTDNRGKPKGNIDAELVLGASAVQINRYDKAVVVSGDGDFRCLYEYLEKKRKLLKIVIPNRKSQSSLLNKFHKYKIFVEDEKHKLEYKK